jgi:hypothetical protein
MMLIHLYEPIQMSERIINLDVIKINVKHDQTKI